MSRPGAARSSAAPDRRPSEQVPPGRLSQRRDCPAPDRSGGVVGATVPRPPGTHSGGSEAVNSGVLRGDACRSHTGQGDPGRHIRRDRETDPSSKQSKDPASQSEAQHGQLATDVAWRRSKIASEGLVTSASSAGAPNLTAARLHVKLLFRLPGHVHLRRKDCYSRGECRFG